MSQKIDSTDIFNKWLEYLRRNQEDRYTYSSRREHIEMLTGFFYKFQIDYEDAKMYKKQVVKAIVSEIGIKEKGKRNSKYGNWVSNVETDFDSILADRYIENPIPTETPTPEPIKYDDRIVDWARNKYGDSKSLIDEAHNVGTSTHLEFLNDTYF